MAKKIDYASLYTLRADGRYMGYYRDQNGKRKCAYEKDVSAARKNVFFPLFIFKILLTDHRMLTHNAADHAQKALGEVAGVKAALAAVFAAAQRLRVQHHLHL